MNRNSQIETNSRIGIFVDTHNLFLSGRDQYQVKINYNKLLDLLADGRDIICARAYLMIKDMEGSEGFQTAIEKAGYDVLIKQIEFREYQKKVNLEEQPPIPTRTSYRKNVSNWDVGMSLDIVKWAPKLDTAVIVSGNGCFIDVVKRLENDAVRIEIAAFRDSTSSELIKLAHDFVDLSPKDINDLPDYLINFDQQTESKGNLIATKV
jgi:uncharacterized LabA/DUF88 family protein